MRRRVLLLGMILLGVGTAIFVAQDALGAAAQRAERDSSVDQDSLGMFAPEAPLASADLSLSKIDTPDPIGIGNQLTYQITVLNTGPDSATNVVLTDTLPAGVGLVSVVPSQGSCSGTTTIVCNLANLASGNSAMVTILVSADAAGTLTNTAEVSSDDADPDLTDNTAVATTEVLTGPDVGVSKSDLPDPVFVGDQITYALTVTNHGPGKAKGIVLTDTLPSEVSLVSATPAQGMCSGTATVVCALGDLNNRQSTQVTIVVTANAPGRIANTAEIATGTYDPTPGNDTASTSTTVRTEYDLGIAKSDSPDPVALGDNLIYTIQVTNYGTSTASGVVMTDDLPGGVSYVSVTSSQGSCSGSGPVVCNLGNIAGENSALVTLVVKTNSSGLIINTAEVTSPVEEIYLGNNTATESTIVDSKPTVDWMPPWVHDKWPPGGNEIVYGGYVTLKATASDDAGVKQVNFFRWDAVNTKYVSIGSDFSPPYEWNFDTSVLNPNVNQIFIQAIDLAGNKSALKWIWLLYLEQRSRVYLPVILR